MTCRRAGRLITSYRPTRSVLATGGYSNVYYLSTNAKGCNVTASWRALQTCARRSSPIPASRRSTRPASRSPGEYQSKLTLDERVAAQRRPHLGAEARRATGALRRHIPEDERDYYLERRYPALRQPGAARRGIPRRQARWSTPGYRGRPTQERGVYLDFGEAIERLGQDRCDRGEVRQPVRDVRADHGRRARYEEPMRIYPAPHYTMGGLWVDYNLMSNIPGLFVMRRGELLGPRREPARRLRADARARRRLLRAALHDRRLPGRSSWPNQIEHPNPTEFTRR